LAYSFVLLATRCILLSLFHVNLLPVHVVPGIGEGSDGGGFLVVDGEVGEGVNGDSSSL
jgi:hypothetical protein